MANFSTQTGRAEAAGATGGTGAAETTGATGITEIVARRGAGRVALSLRTGLLSPRIISNSGHRTEIVLIATHATLLGGDDLSITVDVGPGVHLDLRDVAATVAYAGRGRNCFWRMQIRVGKDATLRWQGEPLVVSDDAIVHRSLNADVAEGGRLLLRDTVARGRAGQHGGELHCTTRMSYSVRPALAEDLTLSATTADLPGHTGPAKVLDTVTAIGWRPRHTPGAFELAQPGAMHRVLLGAAHESPLDQTYAAWAGSEGARTS